MSEVNLDDDDDIFKSARLEPEPAKMSPEPVPVTNGANGHSGHSGHSNNIRAESEEPVGETDIPLEDDEDERPFDNVHLKPGLQLQSEPATINIPSNSQTLTSFHEVNNP